MKSELYLIETHLLLSPPCPALLLFLPSQLATLPHIAQLSAPLSSPQQSLTADRLPCLSTWGDLGLLQTTSSNTSHCVEPAVQMHSRFPDRLPLSLYILHPSLAVLLPFLPFSAESELQLQYVCVLAHINTQCFLKEKERGVFRREAVKRRRNREYEYFLTPKKEGEGREEGGEAVRISQKKK